MAFKIQIHELFGNTTSWRAIKINKYKYIYVAVTNLSPCSGFFIAFVIVLCNFSSRLSYCATGAPCPARLIILYLVMIYLTCRPGCEMIKPQFLPLSEACQVYGICGCAFLGGWGCGEEASMGTWVSDAKACPNLCCIFQCKLVSYKDYNMVSNLELHLQIYFYLEPLHDHVLPLITSKGKQLHQLPVEMLSWWDTTQI